MTPYFNEIRQRLTDAGGWQQKYREIMLLGKSLPAMPDAMKIDEALVPGCESKVWLHLDFSHDEGTLVVVADSDTRIVRGLVAIILSLFNGVTPEQAITIDTRSVFDELGLIKHLSPSRGNGIRAIVQRIQQLAGDKLG